ncbi:MAG: GNAT family N-acetyltransferase [Acetobacterium sp.]|nr:GNAT family N-acetyltransferase [Bacillota bacterium]MCG2730307.1 GNAT family N-acetyltransferase [Acetobacterium sp.]
MQKPIIRSIRKEELPVLREFMYLAIFVEEGSEPLPTEIVDDPRLIKYIQDFGRVGDACLVAVLQKEVIGVVWSRLFPANCPGYGYYDEKTPELSIAVKPKWRGQGIGFDLMSAMLKKLREAGYLAVSLSVTQNNPAVALYKKCGFEILAVQQEDFLMLLKQ